MSGKCATNLFVEMPRSISYKVQSVSYKVKVEHVRAIIIKVVGDS